jgi:FkbM family methyltransferase
MFPPHMFYQDWIPELYRGRGALGRLSEQLGDDVSRSNLDAIVGFRMTKDVGALAPVVDWNVYYPEGIVKLTGDEVYVDAGAYDGDSVKVFVSRCGGHFNSVYAFEPDPNTAERLKKNFQSDKRVTAVPKGLFDRSGALKFHDDGSRGARISEDGTHEIPVVSLDEFLSGKRVTFIKMNIEGAELAALEGAKTAIAAWKPRLAISAYHRPSDLWQIPALMKKLNDKYVLALRQHDLGVIETVAYAF